MEELTNSPINVVDDRSNLLKQIEAGKKLRPIEQKKRQSQVKLHFDSSWSSISSKIITDLYLISIEVIRL